MIILQCPAPAELKSVVLSFAERRCALGADVVTVPLPARPDQFMEFYLADRYAVAHDDGVAEYAPEAVIVGPQSYRRARLFLTGTIHVFTIRFQPGGFHALFGIAMQALVNEGVSAADVLGRTAANLRDDIMSATDFETRVTAAQRWIAACLSLASPIDAVAQMAAAMYRSGGRLSIRALARRAELSDRQFTRRFESQVGLTPKLFARTVRLNAVFQAKARSPGTTWTKLVHRAGYADQAHFVRDCRALAGSPPSDFFVEWIASR